MKTQIALVATLSALCLILPLTWSQEYTKELLGIGPGKCEEITIPMCRGIKYNYTRMPNAFNHETQDEAAIEVTQFWALVSLVKCSSDLQFFLCSIYAPICMEDYDRSLPACRSVCLRAKAGCAPLMKKYGFVWPERMNCDSLPNFGDTKNLCMDYKNGTLPPTATTSSAPAVPPISGLDALPEPPKECSCSCKEPFVKIKKTSPLRNLGISVAGVPECAFPCNGSAYFSNSDLEFADSWISSWAVFCCVSTLLTVTTFCIDTERFKYPERATIILSGCYFMVSIGYILRMIIGREEVACFGGAVRYGASGNVHCTVVFILVYFFGMAAAVWWVVLSVTWFLAAGLKWGTEAIAGCSLYFHLAGWLLPALQTIVALLIDAVDGDSISGLCYVGSQNVLHLRYLVLAPLATYLGVGTTFLIAGFVSLWRIRRVLRRQGAAKADKLERLMVRVGVFGILYFVPAAVVLACLVYEQGSREEWHRAKACTCAPDTGPNFPVFMLKHFMTVAVGITSGFWVWSGKTVASWKRFYLTICGGWRQGSQGARLKNSGAASRAPSALKQPVPLSHV